MSQLGLGRPVSPVRSRLTFKAAAKSVLALTRMTKLAREWRQQNAGKTRLRTQAYPDTRGRPFVA